MTISTQFMNVIPYGSAKVNPSGGWDFIGVSGVKISTAPKISVPFGFQFALATKIQNGFLSSCVVYYQGLNVGGGAERVIRPESVGTYGGYEIWRWTQLLTFDNRGSSLYLINVYLFENDIREEDTLDAQPNVVFAIACDAGEG